MFKMEATHLRGNRWAIRTAGQLGTCGSFPFLWTVRYVTAGSAEEAMHKFERPLIPFDTMARRR